MEIELCARGPELALAWEREFADVPQVRVVRGDILERRADALVSPANSFGYMDGGLDLVYSQFFGWGLETSVRREILERHQGELPVGQAIIVPTGHERFPWLVSAPTMRVPMRTDETVHAMLAFRAVLLAVAAHNAPHNAPHNGAPITSIACPGLCTGEGRMPPSRCARQMRYAWAVVMEGHLERIGGLAGAVRNHLFLLER